MREDAGCIEDLREHSFHWSLRDYLDAERAKDYAQDQHSEHLFIEEDDQEPTKGTQTRHINGSPAPPLGPES